MAKMMDDLTLEELVKMELEIATQRMEYAKLHKQVRALIDARRMDTEAVHKVAGMSAAEKQALLQVLTAEGIPSAEQFGKIGG